MWWTLLGAVLIAAGGLGAVHFLNVGPQSAFVRFPVSPTNLAWLGSGLALAGFGAVAGLLARSAWTAVRGKFKK